MNKSEKVALSLIENTLDHDLNQFMTIEHQAEAFREVVARFYDADLLDFIWNAVYASVERKHNQQN